MRILAFGGSITQGFWDSSGGWVERLRRHYDNQTLKNRAFSEDYPTVFNLGISGETSSRLLKRLEPEITARKFPGQKFVFLFSIGTNNSLIKADGSFNDTVENFTGDIKEIINTARQFSEKIIFVGMPPCEEDKTKPVAWADVSFTNDRILKFEKAARAICEEQRVAHVAVYETFQDQMAQGAQLYADGLHPNDEGHELIFQLVRPVLDELLSE